MIFEWQFIIDTGILGMALILASWIQAKIAVFQRFLIPASLTAGFFLFPLYNWVFPQIGLGSTNLENLIYHLLNISFIANTLRMNQKEKKNSRDILATSTTVLSQYAVQCFAGTAITLLLIYYFLPDLFPGFGLFATLGYAMGPGQAFAIGSGWEATGFPGLGSVGLTFGALGFFWASIAGVFIINYGIKKGWISEKQISQLSKGSTGTTIRKEGRSPDKGGNFAASRTIDSLSFQLALVLSTYLLTYLLLSGLTWLISLPGESTAMLTNNLWGIMFIFSALTALLVKAVMRGLTVEFVVDNKRLTRIMGFSVDYMVVASIAAINAAVIADYWLPIIIVAGTVGIISTLSHFWLSSRIFQEHAFCRSILVYGLITGTLPTGLALLRIIDPRFVTPASRDYTYAASITFLAAIPILLTANMPAVGALTGDLGPTWIVLGLYTCYLIICFAAYLILSGKRRFQDPGRLWLHRDRQS